MAVAEVSIFKSREERVQERHLKREAVLTAAVRLFNAKGFHAASLDSLAAQLGVGKPTIYHYLGNKEQVLLECITRGLDQLRSAVREAHQVQGTGMDRLRVGLQVYGEITLTDYGRCVVKTEDECLSEEGKERFRQLKSQIDHALRELVVEGQEDGSIHCADARIAAFTLAGAINWMSRWYHPSKSRSASKTVEDVVAVLIQGLRPDLGHVDES